MMAPFYMSPMAFFLSAYGRDTLHYQPPPFWVASTPDFSRCLPPISSKPHTDLTFRGQSTEIVVSSQPPPLPPSQPLARPPDQRPLWPFLLATYRASLTPQPWLFRPRSKTSGCGLLDNIRHSLSGPPPLSTAFKYRRLSVLPLPPQALPRFGRRGPLP